MRRLFTGLASPVVAAFCTGIAQAQTEAAPPVTLPGTESDPLPACRVLLDEAGAPVTDEAGNTVYDETALPVLGDDDAPILDEAGEPLTQACAVPLSEMDAGAHNPAIEEVAETEPLSAFTPVLEIIDAGGPVMIVLAILAVLALAVGLVKLVQFVWLGVGQRGFVHTIVEEIRAGMDEDAITTLDARRNPVARVMAAALRGKINPDMNDTLVREETTRVAQAQLDGLERGLALLSLIATIAPLLGLLGTVIGMIEAFQAMENVGDRVEPALLAGGIWEALLTTAAGLSIAIPAATLFTWFQRAVDVEAQKMEDAATQVFTLPLYKAVKS